MTNKSKIVPVLLIVIITASLVRLQTQMIQIALCAKWHFQNQSKVQFHGATVQVPAFWWVTEKNENEIFLSSVSPLGFDFFGLVGIYFKEISNENFEKIQKTKDVRGIELKIPKRLMIQIDNVNVHGLIFDAVVSDGKKNKEFEYHMWNIPEKKIVIKLTGVPKQKIAAVMDFIKQIRFE